MSDITKKIQRLPVKPGVYLFKNSLSEIVYVGKAVRLRQRVQQYFSKRVRDNKTLALVAEVSDLEWIQTETELDALILEAELVKRHQPRYNILLRDDKSNIYIKITLNKTIPDITLVRLPNDERATYFGPYYNAYPIRQALRYLRRIFPYFARQYDASKRSSLYSQIGLEPDVSTATGLANYRRDLRQLVRFLRGGRLEVAAVLDKNMHQAAKRQDFEMAALYRNKLHQLHGLQQKIHLQDYGNESAKRDPGLLATQQLFGLKNLPSRLEGFDVSHLGGTNVVASMVVFINGLPSRPDYRRFKIQTEQNNDVAAIGEVVRRRLRPSNVSKWSLPDLILVDGGRTQLAAAIKELKQTGAADVPIFALSEKMEEVVVNLKKSNVILKSNPLQYKTGDYVSLQLPKNHPALRLFQRVRDEAHRFAINYQSGLKRKQQLTSGLDGIAGIGPATRRKLQRVFDDSSQIKQTTLAELAAVVGPHKAKLVHDALRCSS